jgi:acyl-CoA thioesterase FadM
MYPWLRLIHANLALLGTQRVDTLAITRVRLRVWPNDLDFNLHVNNGRYLTLADIARMHWFMSTGVWEAARRWRAIPIVGDALAKFRKDLRVFQSFDIETRMLGWDHRWGFLEHRFVRAGRVLGVVAIRGVFKGPDGPMEPSALLSSLGKPTQSPPLPQWIVDWNAGCESLSQLLRDEEQEKGLR